MMYGLEGLRDMWLEIKGTKAEMMREAHERADRLEEEHRLRLREGVRAARNEGRTKASIAREIGISRSTLDKIMEGSW